MKPATSNSWQTYLERAPTQLNRGKVWIDATDYALSKIEGEPARYPSFWITKTVVHHSYRKVGDFWLPARNESNTDVRLGGHAVLSIEYGDYKVVAQTTSPSNLLHEQSESVPSSRVCAHLLRQNILAFFCVGLSAVSTRKRSSYVSGDCMGTIQRAKSKTCFLTIGPSYFSQLSAFGTY